MCETASLISARALHLGVLSAQDLLDSVQFSRLAEEVDIVDVCYCCCVIVIR